MLEVNRDTDPPPHFQFHRARVYFIQGGGACGPVWHCDCARGYATRIERALGEGFAPLESMAIPPQACVLALYEL